MGWWWMDSDEFDLRVVEQLIAQLLDEVERGKT